MAVESFGNVATHSGGNLIKNAEIVISRLEISAEITRVKMSEIHHRHKARINPAKLKHRNSFNVASMSFTPEILAAEIRKRMPSFEIDYDIDPVKAAIADSWPNQLDDTCAREEWGWKPQWDISSMTDDMLAAIAKKLEAEKL